MLKRPQDTTPELNELIAKWNNLLESAGNKIRNAGCYWDKAWNGYDNDEWINHGYCLGVNCGVRGEGIWAEQGDLMPLEEIASYYSRGAHPAPNVPVHLKIMIEDLERDLSKDKDYYDEKMLRRQLF